MLRTILNKSWWQHPTKHQLYGHLPLITKTIQVRRTRTRRILLENHGRAHKWCTPIQSHIWSSKSRLTSSNIHTAALKTCQRRWTIGRSGKRGSGISVLAATTWWWWWYIYIYIYIYNIQMSRELFNFKKI